MWKNSHVSFIQNPLNERSIVQMQSQSFVNLELQLQSVLPTAKGVMSVKLSSSFQGFYELDIRQARK